MTQLNFHGARRGFLILAATLLASCGTLPPVSGPGVPSEQRAQSISQRGDHAGAAAQYESLAQSAQPPQQADLLLSAVREWLAAGRAEEAVRVLATVRAPLNADQSQNRALLDSETSLVSNRPQEAWQKISVLPEPTNPTTAEHYWTLRERIAFGDGRIADGIRSEIAAERFVAGAPERSALRAQLLNLLRAARDRGARFDASTVNDPTVKGWLEFGNIVAPSRGGASLTSSAESARWRAKYPGHPATELLSQALPTPLPTVTPGGKVALLLPLTGNAASQAATVRDGFLSAYYQLPEASRPGLKIYDTGALPAAEALAQARAAGSSFIVGPLLRDEVAAAAETGAQSAPLLALNFLSTGRSAPGGFYQYALSPEEEAEGAARRILADGHKHGVVIVPRGDWGSRVYDAFSRALTAGGGSLIGQANYDPNGHDYGPELENVLRVDESQARWQRLQNVLGTKLNFEPRHRGDIEFVFIIAASSTNARLIVPQLKYFYAGDIPEYSTSNAYDTDSVDANRDAEGLMYPDMPWMISGDSAVDDIRTSIQQAWGNRAAWNTRLFAFGYDACQLMVAMSSDKRNPADVRITGLTGQLHFDDMHRVERDLVWVQMRNGEPKPLAEAEASAQQ